MKKRRIDLSEHEFKDTLDALYTAASTVHGRQQMKLFLRDLLTLSERIMCGGRIQIARMLLKGVEYRDISRELRVGYGTIARVQKWLSGLEFAIKEMEKEFDLRDNKYTKSLINKLKRKYPLYFFLIPGIKK